MFSNKNKTAKIQSTNLQKVGKVVLWILVAFLILRGIGSILKKDPSKDIDKKVNTSLSSIENQRKVQEEASAYAAGFAKEFLTYKEGDNEEYRKRVSKYIPQNLSGQIPSVMTNVDVQAMDIVAISSEFYNQNQLDVNVRARVSYSSKVKGSTGEIEDKVVVKDVYLKVPVYSSNGKYIIEDLPVYIAKPENASIEFKTLNGTAADSNITSAIENMLKNFLKTYCEGNDSELTYYMNDAKTPVHGLGGGFTFKSINELKVYTGNQANENTVIVNFSIEDKDSGQEIRQRINLQTIKKEDRYYIKALDARSSNLKIGGSENDTKTKSKK